jgi:hypothetical protein
MYRPILISLLLASTLFTTTTWARTDCEALLSLMHAAREDTRAGKVWTPDQVATWNTWKADCESKDVWRKRLAAIPPPPDYQFVPGPSTDGSRPGDYGYDPAADRARAGQTGHIYYVPRSPSWTSCTRLANHSYGCYTTGGW